MDLLGLKNLPPEIAAALEPVIQQLETRVDEMVKSSLAQVNGIVEAALDRIDGAEVVVVCTIKLPQVGSKMAVPGDGK
ncbi:MAG: hypothetical protein QOE26_2773 [Verrucomicrobiota bacterium]